MTANENGLQYAYPGEHAQYSLTKRELFAMAAMQGIIASDHMQTVPSKHVAEWAVTQADDLLAALRSTDESEAV